MGRIGPQAGPVGAGADILILRRYFLDILVFRLHDGGRSRAMCARSAVIASGAKRSRGREAWSLAAFERRSDVHAPLRGKSAIGTASDCFAPLAMTGQVHRRDGERKEARNFDRQSFSPATR
jgi:hypothetical protein